jgi:hypothetical protein
MQQLVGSGAHLGVYAKRYSDVVQTTIGRARLQRGEVGSLLEMLNAA